MKCENCGAEYESNFCPNCGANSDQFVEKTLPEQPICPQTVTDDALSAKQQPKFRTNMKVWMIIFFSHSAFFALLSIAEQALLSITIFFGIIGSMFLLLGLSPKTTKYMFGKTRGLRKGLFVAICITTAFTFAVALANTSDSTEPDDNSTQTSQTQKEDTDKTPSAEGTHKHEWEKATCEKPATCKGCGETKDAALGHTTDCGICSRCDKEFRKKSPVTIVNWTHDMDFLGGVTWSLKIRNNTDKQIKYVTIKWDCYNAVGDLIYDEISVGPQSYQRMKFTGPLDAHSTSATQRTSGFYNSDLDNYKINEINVEYMDGTTEKVTEYHDNVVD